MRIIGPIPATDSGGPPPGPVVTPPGQTPTLGNTYAVPEYRREDDAEPDGGLTPFQSGSPSGLHADSDADGLCVSTGTPTANNNINFGGDQGRRRGPDDRGHRRRQQHELPAHGSELSPAVPCRFSTRLSACRSSVVRDVQPDRRNDACRRRSRAGAPKSRSTSNGHTRSRPDAKLEIVEGSSFGLQALFTAMETAVTKLGASVVSMSFGAELRMLTASAPWSNSSIKPTSRPALAANPNVTFLASTGDTGADPGPRPHRIILRSRRWSWPSAARRSISPRPTSGKVKPAGATAAIRSPPRRRRRRHQQLLSPSRPSKSGFQNTGFRTVPDVSADADPNTGVGGLRSRRTSAPARRGHRSAAPAFRRRCGPGLSRSPTRAASSNGLARLRADRRRFPPSTAFPPATITTSPSVTTSTTRAPATTW